MNRKKKKRGAEKNGRLRDQLRKAAEGLKDKSERAKNMNEETKKEQEAAQETQSPEVPEMQSLEDDAQALAAELEKVKAQCDEYLDLAQRKQAEFANYRRRTEGIRQEAFDDGRRDAIEKLLPVIDNLERALKAETADAEYKKGVELTMTQLVESLKGIGVEKIAADPGTTFDPNLMNAVMHIENEELGENVVAEVFQQGFRIGDKVIRHAMVQVAN